MCWVDASLVKTRRATLAFTTMRSFIVALMVNMQPLGNRAMPLLVCNSVSEEMTPLEVNATIASSADVALVEKALAVTLDSVSDDV
jgi:hypothetical protein